MNEGKSSNYRLWGNNSQVRENGVLKIGSYINFLNPLSILNRLGNENPIIESRHLVVIMDTPRMVNIICAEFGLVQNNIISLF